jgi:hypothetical protein
MGFGSAFGRGYLVGKRGGVDEAAAGALISRQEKKEQEKRAQQREEKFERLRLEEKAKESRLSKQQSAENVLEGVKARVYTREEGKTMLEDLGFSPIDAERRLSGYNIRTSTLSSLRQSKVSSRRR